MRAQIYKRVLTESHMQLQVSACVYMLWYKVLRELYSLPRSYAVQSRRATLIRLFLFVFLFFDFSLALQVQVC